MKKYLVLLVILFALTACAQTIKYKRQPFTPPKKAEAYKLPASPLSEMSAFDLVFIKKDPIGRYVTCPKAEAELTAFTAKDLNKVTLTIQYYKEMAPQLESLVNLHIQRENLLIDFIVDQNFLKELLREWNVDIQNKAASDKTWWNVEKGGYWGVIIGLIIEAAILAAH
jgi:hypothetical protein